MLATESVVGASTIAYGSDHDDLLIEAGEESITRDPVLGAVIGTTLGDVTSLVTYSSHAEVSALAYAHADNGLYEVGVTRDALGRLLSKTETVGGVTTVESYTYDGAGRLDTVERDGLPAFDADYDDNGNRIALTTSNGTRTSYHDDQDRLIENGDLDFVFNAAGELASRTDVVTKPEPRVGRAARALQFLVILDRHTHDDLSRLHVERDALHAPRPRDPQELRVQLSVLHAFTVPAPRPDSPIVRPRPRPRSFHTTCGRTNQLPSRQQSTRCLRTRGATKLRMATERGRQPVSR
ncbi:MAG: hypothetical protein IPK74_21050 [Deltaproteobacteria bacterium]|nr:hypothetical protein [Deltaproteobacteria bacterium]